LLCTTQIQLSSNTSIELVRACASDSRFPASQTAKTLPIGKEQLEWTHRAAVQWVSNARCQLETPAVNTPCRPRGEQSHLHHNSNSQISIDYLTATTAAAVTAASAIYVPTRTLPTTTSVLLAGSASAAWRSAWLYLGRGRLQGRRQGGGRRVSLWHGIPPRDWGRPLTEPLLPLWPMSQPPWCLVVARGGECPWVTGVPSVLAEVWLQTTCNAQMLWVQGSTHQPLTD
jgi:hypothetical protein